MNQILRLENTVMPYAWGSRTAIALVLGRAPADEPEAELWMGAHPKSPSLAWVEEGWQKLDRLIQSSPAAFLGQGLDELPFMLKILAAERALSIQAHPDHQQALAGFAAEEARGIPVDAEERSYRDRNAKPEILLALESFSILRGFRPVGEILSLCDRLDLERVLAEVGALRREPNSLGLATLFAASLNLEPEKTKEILGFVLQALECQALFDDPIYRWIPRLADQFPADGGALAPLWLNVVRLEAGEAIHTGPGILHAYLEGVGIELMANSDNVLRGGLTTKHVDKQELLTIVRFEPTLPALVTPRLLGGHRIFEDPERRLQLSLIDLDAPEPLERAAAGRHRAEILFALTGSGELEHGAGRQSFARGQSFFVPAAVGAYRLIGHGKVIRASAATP
jgi:mannose-6-phosphate isomerase